ncbi:unnamed protein product [Thlaspi arvense]|uniref:Jacalin-type lectin domain-containing protein n=1 Tax=Thlaspi arvense TaxID=13288 RepID=A0AAU9REB6_THLAR|nr:unnamed protein product [Thlaspi arvense]
MSQDSNLSEMAQRLEAVGNTISQSRYDWDDGSDHCDVTKIYVRCGLEGIQFVKFDYVKTGQPKDGAFHGHAGEGLTQMFEINHLKNEHLKSVLVYHCGSVEPAKWAVLVHLDQSIFVHFICGHIVTMSIMDYAHYRLCPLTTNFKWAVH